MNDSTDAVANQFRMHVTGLLSDINDSTVYPADTLDSLKQKYDGKFATFTGAPFSSRGLSVFFDQQQSTVCVDLGGLLMLKASQFMSLVDQGKVTLSDHE